MVWVAIHRQFQRVMLVETLKWTVDGFSLWAIESQKYESLCLSFTDALEDIIRDNQFEEVCTGLDAPKRRVGLFNRSRVARDLLF